MDIEKVFVEAIQEFVLNNVLFTADYPQMDFEIIQGEDGTEIPAIGIGSLEMRFIAWYLALEDEEFYIYEINDMTDKTRRVSGQLVGLSTPTVEAFALEISRTVCPACEGSGETTDVDPAHCPGGVGVCRTCNGYGRVT